LPDNEIHEIQLLFLNYCLLQKKYKTLYLSASVPLEDLKIAQHNFPEASFITCFTVYPEQNGLDNYLENFKKEYLLNERSKLYVFGKQVFGKTSNTFNIEFVQDYKLFLKTI
jgi:hypothetical protein